MNDEENVAPEEHPQNMGEMVETKNRRPWLTYTLISICVGVAVLNGFSTDLMLMTIFGAKVNDLIADGEYWRLVTSVFLHFGALHLAFNMLFLYNMGPVLESIFGRWRYLVIYLTAGVMGSVASFAFSNSISVGASGALFGLMGSLLYFWLSNPELGKRIGKDIIILLAFNIIFGLVNKSVDNWAHFGGLVGGFLTSAFVGLPGEAVSRYKKVAALAGLCILTGLGITYGLQLESSPARSNFALQRRLNLAEYLIEKKDYTGASTQAQKVLAREPGSPLAHYLLAVAYMGRNDYKSAVSELKMVVQARPDLPEVHFYLGYSLAKLGNKAEAIIHLSEAVRVKPDQALFKQTLESVKNNQPLPE